MYRVDLDFVGVLETGRTTVWGNGNPERRPDKPLKRVESESRWDIPSRITEKKIPCCSFFFSSMNQTHLSVETGHQRKTEAKQTTENKTK